MYFFGKKNGIRDSNKKKRGIRDSREKRAGMRDQHPPFQTLVEDVKPQTNLTVPLKFRLED